MPTTPDPLRTQLAGLPSQPLQPSDYSGYRRGRAFGSARRGRLLMIAIFFALRAADAMVCFAGPEGARSPAVAGVLTGAIWTTALIIGIWFRQEWCRWALLVVLIGCIFSDVFILRAAFDIPFHPTPLIALLIVAFIDSSAAWAVTHLRDIRRLTSRSYASRPYGYG